MRHGETLVPVEPSGRFSATICPSSEGQQDFNQEPQFFKPFTQKDYATLASAQFRAKVGRDAPVKPDYR